MSNPRHASRIAVYGLLVHAGQMLLCRVAPGHRGEGSWTLPGGGIKWGETFREALNRGFAEETSVDTNQEGFAFESNTTGELDTDVRNHQVVFSVTARPGQIPVAKTGGSTDKVEWIDLEVIGALPLSPLVERVLTHLDSQT
jgi:8-oxo-dGTP diphosphatase